MGLSLCESLLSLAGPRKHPALALRARAGAECWTPEGSYCFWGLAENVSADNKAKNKATANPSAGLRKSWKLTALGMLQQPGQQNHGENCFHQLVNREKDRQESDGWMWQDIWGRKRELNQISVPSSSAESCALLLVWHSRQSLRATWTNSIDPEAPEAWPLVWFAVASGLCPTAA